MFSTQRRTTGSIDWHKANLRPSAAEKVLGIAKVQKAGIRTSGPAFCPRLSAFVTWNGGPNSNIRSCVVEGRNPDYGGSYIVHVDPVLPRPISRFETQVSFMCPL